MANRVDDFEAGDRRIVLGVDPGLEQTGYAVIEMPRRAVFDAGLITTDVDSLLARRLCEIDEGLQEVLREYHVDMMAVEDLYAHYKHPRTAILMGHARGVILRAAAARGIEIVDLPATKIKKTMTGNGHASKLQIQRAIMAALHLDRLPEPADVADAMAAALCASILHESQGEPITNGGMRA